MTVEFFDRYAARYELYGSDVLLRELSADPDNQRRDQHFRTLQKHRVAILAIGWVIPAALAARVGYR